MENNDMDMDFGELLEQRMNENTESDAFKGSDAQDERLREMTKKLPSWSLEPPFGFMR